jgi:hypothetical protein
MGGSEISRPFPYSPRSTEPPARKRKVHCELSARVAPERREHQLLIRGLPAEQGWVPSLISVLTTHAVLWDMYRAGARPYWVGFRLVREIE